MYSIADLPKPSSRSILRWLADVEVLLKERLSIQHSAFVSTENTLLTESLVISALREVLRACHHRIRALSLLLATVVFVHSWRSTLRFFLPN